MQLKHSFERDISDYDVIVVVVITDMLANVVCNIAMLLPPDCVLRAILNIQSLSVHVYYIKAHMSCNVFYLTFQFVCIYWTILNH